MLRSRSSYERARPFGRPRATSDHEGLKFALDNARKDLRYYTQRADALAVPSPVGDAVHQAFVIASALRFGERFVPSLIESQEKLLGVKILPG